MPYSKPVKAVQLRDATAIDLLNKQAKKEDQSPNHLVKRIVIKALGESKPSNKNTGTG